MEKMRGWPRMTLAWFVVDAGLHPYSHAYAQHWGHPFGLFVGWFLDWFGLAGAGLLWEENTVDWLIWAGWNQQANMPVCLKLQNIQPHECLAAWPWLHSNARSTTKYWATCLGRFVLYLRTKLKKEYSVSRNRPQEHNNYIISMRAPIPCASKFKWGGC